MDTSIILNRNEVPKEYTWATQDLYPTDEAFLADVEKFKQLVKKADSFNGRATTSAANLLEFYEYLNNEEIPLTNRIMHYSMLKSDEDTSNTVYQDYKNKVSALAVELQSAGSFFPPQLMSLSDDTLESYYKELPELEKYRISIEDIRRTAAHTLDEQSEKIAAMAGEMMETPENVFSLLSNADLTFETVQYNGREYPITQSSFVPLLQDSDQELRKLAFKTYYKSYDQFKNTYAALLSSQVKALAFNSKIHKYNSSLEAALDVTNVDTAVYHNLIEAVHQNIHYMHEYVALRKKILGLKELHMYDIYAPLVDESSATIPYDQAVSDVLDAVKVYGDEYVSILKSGFNNRWVDIYENKGKRSGAYSAGSYEHPYVLLNYKDNLDSEFTLAHEMGHSMHSYFSNREQEHVYSEYVIFVAEVASTCNESLLMQHLLKKTTDKKERAALINYFLDQFKGTLYRQTMFAEFELRINELVAQGESLTADVLCNEYRKLNEFYYGPDVISVDEIALEWARIPHFYYNFYMFQYATGFSAAIALSSGILKEGQPAVDRYLKFLSAGCTKDPVSLLRDAGVDMASPAPVNEALKLFGSLIKEMEELVK